MHLAFFGTSFYQIIFSDCLIFSSSNTTCNLVITMVVALQYSTFTK